MVGCDQNRSLAGGAVSSRSMSDRPFQPPQGSDAASRQVGAVKVPARLLALAKATRSSFHAYRDQLGRCERLAVAAVFLGAHDLDATHDLPAPLIPVEQEWRQAATRDVRAARDEDEMRGAVRAGDVLLGPRDAPGVSDLLRAGSHHARVGTGARGRLRHRERRAHLAVDDGLQLTRFLRLGGDLVQHDHVAVVRRGAVEDGHVLGNDRREGGRPGPPGSKGNRM